MHTLGFRWLFLSALSIGLLAACTAQTPPASTAKAPEKAATAPQAAPSTVAQAAASPAPQSATSPTAAVKAPASSPSPAAAARVEPKGKLTYAFHFALTPRWLDPQEMATLGDFILYYAVHDALVKPMPGKQFTPSLAETYEIAPDFKSATFKLRDGIKFHNGDPVTPEDVKWTFENYRGTNAKTLKDRTASIETPDAKTVRFVFKEPFLDFMDLYGAYASGAGWILPAKYYQQVGPDGFKAKPIGAGPFKLVQQTVGESMEFEANTDYWRKSPSIKTIVAKGIPENTTRLAALQVGEVDAITGVLPLQAEQIRADPKLQLGPAQSTNYFLDFAGKEKPTSPFNKKQVRQAVSLAMDRTAIVNFHTGGLGENPGNWITRGYAGAIDLPAPEYNVAKAKQLLAEAGYPDGFDAGAMSPFAPNGPLGEFVATQLRGVGITTKINNMERAAFDQKRAEGIGAFPDGIVLTSGSAGTAANQIRVSVSCKGSDSRTCDPEIDDRLAKYDKSVNLQERDQLLKEIQQYMADNVIFVPILRNVFVNAQGPRIINKPEEIWGAYPQYLYLGPFEDVKLKE